jgi:hypothetical protein
VTPPDVFAEGHRWVEVAKLVASGVEAVLVGYEINLVRARDYRRAGEDR